MARSRSSTPLQALSWTTTLNLSKANPPSSLTGDRLLLPPSALEGLLAAASSSASVNAQNLRDTNHDPSSWNYLSPDEIYALQQQQQHQLPHPLMFKIINVANGKSTHVGVREFSAEEDEVVLSSFLRKQLGIDGSADGDVDMDDVKLTISSRTLPKGTGARLRPLEAGYDEDWRPLLETHLRKHFTTLTVGEVLEVSALHGQGGFKFLVDSLKPEDAVCVIDTDIDVSIEAMDEEQARETLKRKLAKKANGEGTSSGGEVIIGKAIRGVVEKGDYVHFQLKKWEKLQPVRVELQVVAEGDEVDILAADNTTLTKPSLEEHVWSNFDCKYPKALVIDGEMLKDKEEVQITVYGYEKANSTGAINFTMLVIQEGEDEDEELEPSVTDPDREICSNCKQPIPKRTMFLHQNFCLRNNVLCRHGCGQVFKRGTENLHWHCPDCKEYGTNTSESTDTQSKHNHIAHTSQKCKFCDHSTGSLLELANHRTNECPGKLILCRFCHLIVPQEDDKTGAAMLSGLAPHEVPCGSRTTDCHLCKRIVQLKSLDAHLKNHDMDRKSKPLPKICRNVNCARTADPAIQIDLCTVCNGPLYSASHDPSNAALVRRVQRRYLAQLLAGCNKSWCRNEMCKTGRLRHTPPLPVVAKTKEATELSAPFSNAETLVSGYTGGPLHFCVDEVTAGRRAVAEMLSMIQDADGKGGWAVEWCVKAVEEVGKKSSEGRGSLEEEARSWLEKWAVRREE